MFKLEKIEIFHIILSSNSHWVALTSEYGVYKQLEEDSRKDFKQVLHALKLFFDMMWFRLPSHWKTNSREKSVTLSQSSSDYILLLSSCIVPDGLESNLLLLQTFWVLRTLLHNSSYYFFKEKLSPHVKSMLCQSTGLALRTLNLKQFCSKFWNRQQKYCLMAVVS